MANIYCSNFDSFHLILLGLYEDIKMRKVRHTQIRCQMIIINSCWTHFILLASILYYNDTLGVSITRYIVVISWYYGSIPWEFWTTGATGPSVAKLQWILFRPAVEGPMSDPTGSRGLKTLTTCEVVISCQRPDSLSIEPWFWMKLGSLQTDMIHMILDWYPPTALVVQAWHGSLAPCQFTNDWLVVEPTPLKNMSQLGIWHSQYMET